MPLSRSDRDDPRSARSASIGDGKDLAIVTYGNGYYLSRQAEALLAADGVEVRIIDLRWLAPLPEDALVEAVTGVERILIVDECRRSGGVAEALMALFAERTDVPLARVTAEDSSSPPARPMPPRCRQPKVSIPRQTP